MCDHAAHRRGQGDPRPRVSGVPRRWAGSAYPGCPALRSAGWDLAARVHLAVGRVLPVDLEHECAALRAGQRGHGGRAGDGPLGSRLADGEDPGRPEPRPRTPSELQPHLSALAANFRVSTFCAEMTPGEGPVSEWRWRQAPPPAPGLACCGRGGCGHTAGLPSGC